MHEGVYEKLKALGLEIIDRGNYIVCACPRCGMEPGREAHARAFVLRDSQTLICSRTNSCGYYGNIDDIEKA